MNPLNSRYRAAWQIRSACAFALVFALLPRAHADGGRTSPAQALPAYQQECGSCHLAYPPGLLPASSWRRIMSGLDQHFGSDASLDAAMAQQIGAWLQAHGGTTKNVDTAPPQDRITRSAWFERKHRRMPTAVWQHASVKSAANCVACHTGAAQGDFDEHRLRFPPGLDKRYQNVFRDD
ncbi:MAG: diheme cytochrome c [Burkholderiaceae bacterium]